MVSFTDFTCFTTMIGETPTDEAAMKRLLIDRVVAVLMEMREVILSVMLILLMVRLMIVTASQNLTLMSPSGVDDS